MPRRRRRRAARRRRLVDGSERARAWLRTEFGLDVAADREIRVWDSSAEVRYLVLPQRPAGTSDMNEPELTALIEREAMIGVAEVKAP